MNFKQTLNFYEHKIEKNWMFEYFLYEQKYWTSTIKDLLF
jgi:hypothetical protein